MKKCLECGQDASATPLVALDYRDSTFWICPRHLPLLIHDPARLIGKLPGAETLSPAEQQD
jgi:hypothetical protein